MLAVLASALLGMLVAEVQAQGSSKNVVVFADFACTDSAAGDPDDCLAVEALRRTASIKILAVVAAGGNANEKLSYELGLEKFPELVVLPGSRPRARYHTKTHRQAAEVIIKSPEPVTILVLSPATDLAELMEHYPSVLSNVRSVLLVAGRSPGDEFRMCDGCRKLRDMNYEKDRRSFGEVLLALHAQRVATVFVGFRAGMNAELPPDFLPTNFVPKSQRAWKRRATLWFGWEPPPFDVVAAMLVVGHQSNLRCMPAMVLAGNELVLNPAVRTGFRFCE